MWGGRLHVLCRHEDAHEASAREGTRLKELELLAGQYRLGVETQMHFNELIMRTRSMGMYGAILVMGSAMLLRSQFPNAGGFAWNIPLLTLPAGLTLGPFDLRFTAPLLIALFGPVLLVIVYLMDRRYYMSLLGGASRYVYQLEDSLEKGGLTLAGVDHAFGQGRTIQRTFGPRLGASTKYVNGAYSLVLVTELIVIFLLLINP